MLTELNQQQSEAQDLVRQQLREGKTGIWAMCQAVKRFHLRDCVVIGDILVQYYVENQGERYKC